MDEEKKAEEMELKESAAPAEETADAAETAETVGERVITAAEKLARETAVFVNVAKLDTKALFKMQTTAFIKSPTNWIFYAVIIVAFSLIAFLRPEGFTLEGALVLVGFILLIAAFIPLTMWIVSKNGEKNAAKAGGDLTQTVTATEEMLYYSASGKTVGFEYGAFVKIMQNKEYYYLITYARQMVMIAKNGFTLGDPGEFYGFVAAKIAAK